MEFSVQEKVTIRYDIVYHTTFSTVSIMAIMAARGVEEIKLSDVAVPTFEGAKYTLLR